MQLSEINLKIITDSRGEETLRAGLKSGDISASADVPSGKSRGNHEAFVLNPQEAAVKFESVKAKILSVSARIENQKAFDDFLIALDGTPDKSNLGGNLILSLSLAWARIKAKSESRELYEYIRLIYNRPVSVAQFPRPIMNVINGGAHARNKLDFQEFQIIPQAFTFEKALNSGKAFYELLGQKLKENYGAENISLGDEAGFSAPFPDNEEALDILFNLVKESNYNLRLGLDVAASHFYSENLESGIDNEGYYLLGGKKYSSDELTDYYHRLTDKYNLVAIEDPFEEEDFESFAKLKSKINERVEPPLVITDDLTTTNPARFKIAIEKKSGNAIIVKPNQIGTLSETIEVCQLANDSGWEKIVSHRSGETEDDFIADLAYGVGAWGIKSGAPAKPERLTKYERLLKIISG